MLESLLRTSGEVGELEDQSLDLHRTRLLESLARSLMLEFGRVDCYVEPHDPERLPLIMNFDIAAGETETVDFEELIGRRSTRGHIINTGNETAYLHWQAYSDGAQTGEAYPLLAAAVIDTSSFVVSTLLITAKDAPASVCVFAQ